MCSSRLKVDEVEVVSALLLLAGEEGYPGRSIPNSGSSGSPWRCQGDRGGEERKEGGGVVKE